MIKTATLLALSLLGVLCVGGYLEVQQVVGQSPVATNTNIHNTIYRDEFVLLDVQGDSQILLEKKTGYIWRCTTDEHASSLVIMVNSKGTAMTLEDYKKEYKRL